LEGRGEPERQCAKQLRIGSRGATRPNDIAQEWGSGSPIRIMGRNADGLPPGLDRHSLGLEASQAHALPAHWPAGPGQAQHAWEPPRTTRQEKDRAARLKALGNAVVPAVGREIGRWILAMGLVNDNDR
jgi:hypothetical protein